MQVKELIDDIGQSRVAAEAGVHQRAVSKYYNANKLPDTESGRKVAYFLLANLLTDESGASIRETLTLNDRKLRAECLIREADAEKKQLDLQERRENLVYTNSVNQAYRKHGQLFREQVFANRRSLEKAAPDIPEIVDIFNDGCETLRKALKSAWWEITTIDKSDDSDPK